MDESIFACKVENRKIISDTLSCLVDNGQKEQVCYFEASSECLTIMTTSKSKSMQARASLQFDMFEEYSCDKDTVTFVVNLHHLLSCVNLHGPNSESSSAVLFYSTKEAVLKLSLEESNVLTVCEIPTMDISDEDNPGLFIAFRKHHETSQLILKSEPLKETLQDFNDTPDISTVSIEVHASPDNALTFVAHGPSCGVKVEFPKTCDAFVSYRCETCSLWRYPASVLLLGLKALGVASETLLRVNDQGMLCIQHQVFFTS